ncbi:MAG: IPT/TIG domain-containing protein [Patescibacteria group bacterium]|jgi:hypothetical protein
MKKLLTAILVGFQLIAAPLLVVAQTGVANGNVAVLYFAPPGESATTGTVKLNATGEFSVDVKINTHGANSAGADVHVTFDNTQIQYVRGSMAGVGSGDFYPVQVKGAPTTTAGVSAANTNEKVSMSRTINSPEVAGATPDYTNGNSTFATLVFKPVSTSPVGTTVHLGFDYTSGATSDSNVTGTTTSNPDILSAAKEADLTIQAYEEEAAVLSSVSLTPASATVIPYGEKTLTATSTDSDGNTITSGVTYAWEVDGDGTLSSTTGSSVIYKALSHGSAEVTVTATQGSVTKSDSSNITISGGVVTDGPEIDYIVPGQGYEDEDVEVDIHGSNFDSDEGRVYVGTRLADIVSWSDSKIVVLVPQVIVNEDTEYQVKVRRSDGEEATYMGYTYLDKTGLPLLPWLIMFPLNGAAAVLAKKKLFRKK